MLKESVGIVTRQRGAQGLNSLERRPFDQCQKVGEAGCDLCSCVTFRGCVVLYPFTVCIYCISSNPIQVFEWQSLRSTLSEVC
jgi:hypothetical protein